MKIITPEMKQGAYPLVTLRSGPNGDMVRIYDVPPGQVREFIKDLHQYEIKQ